MREARETGEHGGWSVDAAIIMPHPDRVNVQ